MAHRQLAAGNSYSGVVTFPETQKPLACNLKLLPYPSDLDVSQHMLAIGTTSVALQVSEHQCKFAIKACANTRSKSVIGRVNVGRMSTWLWHMAVDIGATTGIEDASSIPLVPQLPYCRYQVTSPSTITYQP